MRIRVQTIYSREHNLFSIMPKQYFQLKICSYFKVLVQTGIIKKNTSTGKDPDPGKWYKKWIVGSFRSRQMHCSCFFVFFRIPNTVPDLKGYWMWILYGSEQSCGSGMIYSGSGSSFDLSRVPDADPGKSSRSMRIRIQLILIKYLK